MQEKAKEPEIRFAGFTGAWEQRSLGEICVPVQRNDPYSHAPVMMITASSGFIYQSVRYSFDNSGQSLQKYTLLKKGELAYNHGASKLRPFGSCFALNVKEARIPFVYHSFAVNDDDPEFVSLELNGTNVEKQLRKLVSSGARMDGLLNISFDDYGTVTLPLPSIDEQKKISSFFLKLDSLLTLHQRKYEKLLNIKKSMLEKMFPKEGEVVPEIRFKGFTGAWEQRKFSKLYKRSSEKNDGSIGIERNITVATMQFKSDIRLSSDDYLKTYFTFKVGDIAFEGHQSKEFRYGRFVENDIGDGVVSHIFTVFRPIQRFDLHFWKYAINSENLMQKILSRSTKASTMMHDLVPEDFLNETFLVPSIDEQKAVGKFLHQIDNLLTLHQRKLEMLKNVKQAFLEKMFV